MSHENNSSQAAAKHTSRQLLRFWVAVLFLITTLSVVGGWVGERHKAAAVISEATPQIVPALNPSLQQRTQQTTQKPDSAKTQKPEPSKTLATDVPPPPDLKPIEREPMTPQAGARHVFIGFDGMGDRQTVSNQFPDAQFSTSFPFSVITTFQNYGTTLPNISRSGSFGFNHFAPLYVQFPRPVDNLRFTVLAADEFRVGIAQVRIFQNGSQTPTATQSVDGFGSVFLPINVVITQDNVTRIEVVDVNDYLGLAFDNFDFDVPTPPTPTPTPIPTPIPPTAPTLLTATPDEEEVTLTWTTSPDAQIYLVKRLTAEGIPVNGGTNTVFAPTTTYTVRNLTPNVPAFFAVSAKNGNGESANSNIKSATPLHLCGAATFKPRPVPTPMDGAGWHLEPELSDRDGLVLRNISLKGRPMAVMMSLPYFEIKTNKLSTPRRGELTYDNPDVNAPLRTRLVGYSASPVQSTPGHVAALVVRAQYAVDNISPDSKSCLLINQDYEFYEEAGPGQGCEAPFGLLPCSRFKPRTSYTFMGRDEVLQQVKLPVRLHFKVIENNGEGIAGNSVGVFKDCDVLVQTIGSSPPIPGCTFAGAPSGFLRKDNPVHWEFRSEIIKDGRQLPSTPYSGWDNFHQTSNPVWIQEPGTLTNPTPAGCPECVHIHWRWGHDIATLGDALGRGKFGFGQLLGILPGSRQDLSIQVVKFKPNEIHPTAPFTEQEFEKDVDAIRDRTPLDRSPVDVVFWYIGTGNFNNHDEFFNFGGAFNPHFVRDAERPIVSPAPGALEAQTQSSVQDGPVSVKLGYVYSDLPITVEPVDITFLPFPPGYSALNNTSYKIRTDSILSGQHVVKFNVPSVSDSALFGNLRILHLEQDPFDPEGAIWIDRTILPPDADAPDFASRTLNAAVTGLGQFVIAVRSTPSTNTADLAVSITDSSDPVVSENPLTYTVTVTNGGPQAATNAGLVSGLSQEADLQSVTTTQGTCKFDSGSVYCKFGNLPVGANAVVSINVKPTEAGGRFEATGRLLKIEALTKANEIDGNESNNSAEESTNALPNANARPSVSILSPAVGAQYSSPANISIIAEASDSDGTIASITFFDGELQIGTGLPTGTAGQYRFDWNGVGPGLHAVQAKVTDNGGFFGISRAILVFVNGPATVTILNPTDGTLFAPDSTITLTAAASHSSGSIARVEFITDGITIGDGVPIGGGQFTINWPNVTRGTYVLSAVATDNAGVQTLSAPVRITVAQPPTINITSPVEGAIFPSGPNINITAQTQGTVINKIEFYAGGDLLGTGVPKGNDSFSITWRNAPDGVQSITAVATDDLGLRTTSAPRNIAVNTTSSANPGEFIWFDDALPAGAVPYGDSLWSGQVLSKAAAGGGSAGDPNVPWYWVDANPAPFSGAKAHQSLNVGLSMFGTSSTNMIIEGGTFHQHYFDQATARLAVNAGDKLFTHVFLDINNMPSGIVVRWYDGTTWRGAHWGRTEIELGTINMGPLPKAGQWVRLEVPANLVGLEGKTLSGMAFALDGGRATFDLSGKATAQAPPPPVTAAGDFVWMEDSLPPGAVPAGQHDVWDFVSGSPTPFSGQTCHRSFLANSGTGQFRYHFFTGATTPMAVNPGDALFTYVFLDPVNTPDEIVLMWHDGTSWEHRAFWGRNFVDVGITGTESRRYAGSLPPAGTWVRLEIPASYLGLEGKKVSGMAFGFFKENDRARVSWDRSGKSNQMTTVPLPLSSLTPLWRVFGTGGTGYYRLTTNNVLRWDETIQNLVGYVDPKQAAASVPMHEFRASTDFNARYQYTTNRNGPQLPWVYSGIGFHLYPNSTATVNDTALYQFRDNRGGHFYTTIQSEGAGMLSDGIVGYVVRDNPLVPHTPWLGLITSQCGDLSWRDNSYNETGFEIERKAPWETNWSRIAVVPANTREFHDPCLQPPTSGISKQRITEPPDFVRTRYRIRATSLFGNSQWSEQEVCYFLCPVYIVQPGIGAQVSIASPVNGSAVKSDFTISANAFADEGPGTIAKVEFYDGATKIGELGAPPYDFVWNNVAAGTHSLTAVATDTTGRISTSTPVTVTIGAAPTATITSPAVGALFSAPASITIDANASDPDGSVAKVEFFSGASKIGEDTTAPYSFTWSNVQYGNYEFTVSATDNQGLTMISAPVEVTVNSLPSINITAPANDTVFQPPANISISADAADLDGTVSQVQFYQGTTLIGTATTAPYTTTWNNVASGSYNLTAKATDNRGHTTTSAAVSVIVNNLPTVNVTLPAPNTVFAAPAVITVGASASDSDGTISQVDFYQGSTLIGTDNTSPFNITWPNVSDGTYTLTARATDNRGATSTSPPISIVVNGAPVVSITSPTNNAMFSPQSNIVINASASDPDGTITQVEFYQGGTLIGTDNTAPFSVTWNNVPLGSYLLTAKATDNRGAVSTSAAVRVSTPTFSDDFNDNSLAASKWTIITPSSSAVVTEQAQQLQINVPPNTATYNGVTSTSTYDFRNGVAEVEVAAAINQGGWAENQFSVVRDPQNYYLVNAGAGSILFRSMVNGVNDQTVLTFDPSVHRYWRVRHDLNSNVVTFETSGDGSTWTARKAVSAGFALTAVKFQLIAGAWGTGNGNPGAAKYDNFQFFASAAPLPCTTGALMISEFRFRGAAGANDEFVEFYNNSDSAVTVCTTDQSSGWALAARNAAGTSVSTVFVIPSSTVISARGHLLAVNTAQGGYSLALYPAGNGTTATGDLTYNSNIEDNAGIALFNTSNPTGFTSANKFDAVGFSGATGAIADLYREGTGLVPIGGSDGEYTFVRNIPNGSFVPSDTNNNSADFLFLSTNAGTFAGVLSKLGGPGPENLSSPVYRGLPALFVDSTVAATVAPNRVRDLTSDPANNATNGTLSIRRRIVNNTNASITRLRFRITGITTYPVPSGTADLRALTSSSFVATNVNDAATCAATGTPATAPCSVTIYGTTVEKPPQLPSGGGYNNTLSVTLPQPLAPGASVNVQWLVGLQQTGGFQFFVLVEALP